MQLRKLLTLSQWDLREIFRKGSWTDGFWPHLGAHLVGGVVLWGFCLHLLAPWDAVYVTGGLAAWWVFNVEEANSTRGFNYPIWAMLWDAGTVTGMAALGAVAYGWVR